MKISMLTLGCKVNQYEADALAQILTERGHEIVEGEVTADCYILSTCAVTNEAERKSRQMVTKLRKLNPEARIIVCGCASQDDSQQFATKDNVTIVLGTAGKQWIPELLDKKGDFTVEPGFDYEEIGECKHTHAKTKRTRAYVKVQDGCNNFCSYCLIPFLRGRSRSRSLESVVVEVYNLAKSYQEIILTGINLSAWGQDIQSDLGTLLSSLSNINARIRLSSLENTIINVNLIKVMLSMPNFCPHFHLSIQSACDKTLLEMNRHYTIEDFKKKVTMLREAFPTCAITTDLIVGYPTETEQDFTTTLHNLKEIAFADMHIFPYSTRKGTKASSLTAIPQEIMQDRITRATELRNQMKLNFLKKQFNLIEEVVAEQDKDGFTVGHARNFTKVYIKSGNFTSGQMAMVRLKEAYLDGVKGDFIKLCEND